MKILLTGARGGLGKIVYNKLKIQNRHSLAVLCRRQCEDFPETEIRIGDLSDPASLDSALRKIDTVIHMAAVTHTNDLKKYFLTNAEGTKNLLAAAEKNTVKKFIFISSRAALPEAGAYGRSKYLAEQAVKRFSGGWIIFQPAEIYGLKKNEAIQRLIEQIGRSRFIPIPGRGNAELSPISADDVVDTIIKSIDKDSNRKTYVLAGPQAYQYVQLAEIIAKTLKKKIFLIRIPIFLIRLAFAIFPTAITRDQIVRLQAKKSCDISLAQADFGFHPQNFKKNVNKLHSKRKIN